MVAVLRRRRVTGGAVPFFCRACANFRAVVWPPRVARAAAAGCAAEAATRQQRRGVRRRARSASARPAKGGRLREAASNERSEAVGRGTRLRSRGPAMERVTGREADFIQGLPPQAAHLRRRPALFLAAILICGSSATAE